MEASLLYLIIVPPSPQLTEPIQKAKGNNLNLDILLAIYALKYIPGELSWDGLKLDCDIE